RDHGSGISLIFVRQQKIHTSLEELGVVGCCRQRKPFRGLLPLMDKRFACSLEWNVQRLTESTPRIVLRCAKGDADRELRTARKIQSTSQSNVAIEHFIVLPIEAIVVGQIGPSIIHADVSTRRFGERNGGANCEPCTSFICNKTPVIADL